MKSLKNLFLVLSILCISILVSCSSNTKSTNAGSENNNANIKLFNKGIYEGKIDNEVKSIYVFYDDGEGGSLLNLDGMGLPFAYEIKENNNTTGEAEVLFHMGDATDNTTVHVIPISDTEYIIGVYNLKLVEKDTEKIDEVLAKYNK